MALTEPQAGSSLTGVKTGDRDHYLITGTKTFISSGDHELTDNIVIKQGASMKALITEIAKTVEEARAADVLKDMTDNVETAMNELVSATLHLAGVAASGDIPHYTSFATPYLDMFSQLEIWWPFPMAVGRGTENARYRHRRREFLQTHYRSVLYQQRAAVCSHHSQDYQKRRTNRARFRPGIVLRAERLRYDISVAQPPAVGERQTNIKKTAQPGTAVPHTQDWTVCY